MTNLLNKKLLIESLQLLKKNILYFLLLDALLIVSLYSINYLMSSYIFDFRNMLAVIQQNNVLVLVMLPLMVIYMLILLLMYSVFKYFILEIVAEKESVDKFHNLVRFYSLNTKIFGLFFVVFAVINLIFFSIPNGYMVTYAFATMIPFIFMLTLFIDTLHTNFTTHNDNKLRLKLVFQNKRFIVMKIVFYASIILLYMAYNYLGTSGNMLLIPFTVLAIIYVYLLRKFEIIAASRLGQ